jgi:hypothetical protein
MLRFFGFLDASPDDISEIPLRDALISLAVVCSDARTTANELIDQAVIGRVAWNFPREADYGLTELRGSLFQIEARVAFPFPTRRPWANFGCWTLELLWMLDVGAWSFSRTLARERI